MTNFPTLSYTSIFEILTLLYTQSLKKVLLSGGASLYRPLQGVPPHPNPGCDGPPNKQVECFRLPVSNGISAFLLSGYVRLWLSGLHATAAQHFFSNHQCVDIKILRGFFFVSLTNKQKNQEDASFNAGQNDEMSLQVTQIALLKVSKISLV